MIHVGGNTDLEQKELYAESLEEKLALAEQELQRQREFQADAALRNTTPVPMKDLQPPPSVRNGEQTART